MAALISFEGKSKTEIALYIAIGSLVAGALLEVFVKCNRPYDRTGRRVPINPRESIASALIMSLGVALAFASRIKEFEPYNSLALLIPTAITAFFVYTVYGFQRAHRPERPFETAARAGQRPGPQAPGAEQQADLD